MERISGIDWDLEHVEIEPMGHEWGDSGALDDVYDIPFEAATASEPVISSANAPDIEVAADDFGGGSREADPALLFDEDVSLGASASEDDAEPNHPSFVDPEAENCVVDLAEIDPFDTFDEEFSQVVGEFEAELPVLEEMAEG